MADEIGVKLTAQDQQFTAATQQASSAVAALAEQEDKLAKSSKGAGRDQSKLSKAFRALEKQNAADEAKEKKTASAIASKAQKSNEKATKDLASKADKEAKKKLETQKKNDAQIKKANAYRQKAAAESERNLASDLTMLKSGAVAAVAMGAAVLGVAVAGGVALAAIAKLALAMGNAKAETKGALDILTGGRADKALKLIDAEAVRLGLQIQQTRDDFIKFRQAGLDNKQSAALLKLKADLIDTKHPAEQVQEAVDRVLSYASNGPQTKDQALAAGRAMKLLAKQAHIAGDGTAAAALAATTLEGALNRIDNSKTKALETIGEKIKPSIDKAATAVANMVEKFLDSKRGQDAIDSVGDAIIAIADAVSKAVPKASAAWDALTSALDDPKAKLALDALKGVAYLAAGGLAVLAVGAAALIAPLVAIGAAVTTAVAGVGLLVTKAIDLAPKMYDAGKNIVMGLVNGIKDAASSAVSAIVDLAAKMSFGFTKKLEMHSPSKLFERHGVNIGKGTDKGVEKSMPSGEDVADRVTPRRLAPVARIGQQSAPVAASSRGGDTYITIKVERGENDEQTARRLQHELDLYFQAKRLQEGRAA